MVNVHNNATVSHTKRQDSKKHNQVTLPYKIFDYSVKISIALTQTPLKASQITDQTIVTKKQYMHHRVVFCHNKGMNTMICVSQYHLFLHLARGGNNIILLGASLALSVSWARYLM